MIVCITLAKTLAAEADLLSQAPTISRKGIVESLPNLRFILQVMVGTPLRRV
jgi:hypothetical protein